jgi:hypothetical protein
MAGQPRRRLAFQIVGAALTSLRRDGPATVDQLLERIDWWPSPTRPQIDADAIRIASRWLRRHPCVIVDRDGLLYYTPSEMRNGGHDEQGGLRSEGER